MNLQSLHFLAKSNIKGNKNSGTITLLICLLVISATLISCFSITTTNVINRYKEDYMARALWMSGWNKKLDMEGLKAIESMEHVESVDDYTGITNGWHFNIIEAADDRISIKSEETGTRLNVKGLLKNQSMPVIKGKELDEAPVYSCLVPSTFYPFEDASELDYKDLDYIDGTSLIGKTITIKGNDDKFYLYYATKGYDFYESEEGQEVSRQAETYIKSPEYTLKVVGTYFCRYGLSGSLRTIYVSEETNLLMTKTAIEESGIDLAENKHPVAQWWNDPTLHYYYVIVDDFKNISEVFNKVSKGMGYDICSGPEQEVDKTTLLISNVFKTAGTFLTLAILLISVLLLIQSSVNSIRERKGFIGLMKAIGYKNHQIFASLIYEQLYMTLKAFLIGGAISAAVVLVANYFFKHGTYRQMQYIIDMKVFVIFLGVSFLIALLVPLVTQLLLLRKLVKIQPREAMNTR